MEIDEDGFVGCEECEGTGRYDYYENEDDINYYWTDDCYNCIGIGRVSWIEYILNNNDWYKIYWARRKNDQ